LYTLALPKDMTTSLGMKTFGQALGLSFLVIGSLVHAQKFPEPPDTQKTDLELPTPEESAAGFSLPDGFKVNVFAAEPDVRQPIAMTFDDRGRLWVAECYTYADRKLIYNTELRDRIVIFEDVDGDGKFDKRKVFHDGLQRLTSIALGFGGVWATCAPHFVFIPDRNGDDKPDAEPEVLLDGWHSGKVRHNIANGLKWGPDGWLYGRHGILDTSKVGKPGTPDEARVELRCCIWRYHPTRHKFEVVCEGTTNSWGHDWDEHGQLFFINTVIGHLWHGVPGAFYQRMYGQHYNPHLYELIQQTADHFHWDKGREKWGDLKKKGLSLSTDEAGGGHAHCGMMIYQGDNWPEKYKGKLFTANFHGRRLNCERLERSGAGYVGKHETDFLKVKDLWFRGVELDYGFDGAVYLLDWSDVGECHENDGLHRSSGRIYRIAYGSTKEKKINLKKLKSIELAELQLHSNERLARHARRILQERAEYGKDLTNAKQRLENILIENPNVTRKLRALWCLYSMGELDGERLVTLLRHEEEHIRVWAIQLLVDLGSPNVQTIDLFTSLAKTEQSGLVRLYLASAMRKLPLEKRWPLAAALGNREDLNEDPVFPLMLWYGIESAVSANPVAALKMATSCKISKIQQFIPRRLTVIKN
jgi:putative membrane-bound dehydrogenase-like protein